MITFHKLGRYGRFGNQLFQIAGTIGLATKHGYQFGFPEWKNYDHLERFNSTDDINVQEYFIHHLPELLPGERYPELSIPWGYHDIKIPDNVSLHGHMQSEKYFIHCKDIIKFYFEMEPINDIMVPDNSICVHVRLGDYDTAKNRAYHGVMDKIYYEKALKLMPSGHPIVIFSDEPKKAFQMFGHSCEHVKDRHYMVDFYMMRQCKYFIISNSTLPWWAAWLSGSEKVIAPRQWFGHAAKIKSDDIYPQNWIIL